MPCGSVHSWRWHPALLFPTSARGLGNTDMEFIVSAADRARELGYHLVLWSSEFHDAPNWRTR
ncbi:MAG: hypothetical protein R3A10_21015 [Caldilineaceae bacterium]